MIEFQQYIRERCNLVDTKKIAPQRVVDALACPQNIRDKGHYTGHIMNASFKSGEARQ
ncbi:hypothetical protein SAMN05216316_2836 [Nitrosovibrio sp. Nv6]|nr:hypothetical protein SAMN05216316_2836 [Nitrosovibrio sp. Nv6]